MKAHNTVAAVSLGYVAASVATHDEGRALIYAVTSVVLAAFAFLMALASNRD